MILRFFVSDLGLIPPLFPPFPLSRLYRFEADAPTVTMQRLKGLLTGSLPTFFDAKDNFESSELHEDNWLTQAIHKGRRVHFVGDDTWARLIPILAGCQVNTLSRNMTDSHKSEACSRIVSHPLPSFEVHDLHTVDRGCMKHVPRSLCGQYGDWDILIAHLLGKHYEQSDRLSCVLRLFVNSIVGDAAN